MQFRFLLFMFAFVLMGMTSKASFASSNDNVIKELGATTEYVKIYQADTEEDEDESEDEEEERF